MRRGEIWVANLNPDRGGEIGKARPVLILQEDSVTGTGLRTVLTAPLTTQFRPTFAPFADIYQCSQPLTKKLLCDGGACHRS